MLSLSVAIAQQVSTVMVVSKAMQKEIANDVVLPADYSAEKSYPVLFEDADDFVRSDTLAFLLNGLLGVSEEDLLRNWSSSQSSFDGLKAWLREFPGTTLKSRIAAYAQGCGIDASEIETFRSLMLEEKK